MTPPEDAPTGGDFSSSDISADENWKLRTKMQAILFSIADGIVMTDFDGRIQLLNDAAKRMLGIEKKYPYDRKFLDYIEDKWLRGKLADMLESREGEFTEEISVPGPEPLYIKATKRLVTTARSEVLGAVLALRDITLEKQLEKMKEDFMHAITHDLKSPLTSIDGFLRLFLKGELGALADEQKYYLDIMTNSTQKMLHLIGNILDLVKMEAGRMPMEKAEWDAGSGVRQVVESLQGSSLQCGVKLSYSGPDSAPVQADHVLIERVIGNLVDNALKFTPAEGSIDVSVAERDGKVEFRVADTGKGIAPRYIEQVFEKFNQVPGTKGGTGLGLTISKHIVEAHGGQISVESQVDRGTTFTFWIPKGGRG